MNYQKILIGVLGLGNLIPALAGTFKSKIENDFIYRTEPGKFQSQRLLNEGSYESKIFKEKIDLNFAWLGWFNAARLNDENQSTIPRYVLRATEAYAKIEADSFVFKLGLQRFSHGETFGLQTPDYINPRSFEDFIFMENERSKLGVGALSVQYLTESGKIEGIYVPLASSPRHGSPVLGLRVKEDRTPKVAFRDAEGGARWNHYWKELGIESHLLFYRHFSRVPVYNLKADSEAKPYLATSYHKMNSYSLSLNKAFENWVLRSDNTRHEKMPFMDIHNLSYKRVDLYDGILALDRSWNEDNFLAFQGHYAFYSHNIDPEFWASLRYRQFLFDEFFKTESTLYKGINNQDLWLTSEIQFLFSDEWSWAVGGHYIVSREGGYFEILEHENRLYTVLAYEF